MLEVKNNENCSPARYGDAGRSIVAANTHCCELFRHGALPGSGALIVKRFIYITSTRPLSAAKIGAISRANKRRQHPRHKRSANGGVPAQAFCMHFESTHRLQSQPSKLTLTGALVTQRLGIEPH